MGKWPLIGLRGENTIVIQYLDEIQLIIAFGGHIGLKQPRNLKLDFMCAFEKYAEFYLERSVDFVSDWIF